MTRREIEIGSGLEEEGEGVGRRGFGIAKSIKSVGSYHVHSRASCTASPSPHTVTNPYSTSAPPSTPNHRTDQRNWCLGTCPCPCQHGPPEHSPPENIQSPSPAPRVSHVQTAINNSISSSKSKSETRRYETARRRPRNESPATTSHVQT